jgi:hypothetical protein
MSSRPRRSAAIKALEKIQKIAEEAEKYDDYGEEIEETDVLIGTLSVSKPPELLPWRHVTDVQAEPVKTESEKSNTSSSEPSVSVKTTPNTLFQIASYDNVKYNAYQTYVNDFKTKHVEHIKNYLTLAEDNNVKYIAIPELIKYLITNPSMMIHHSKFGEAVANKMIEFENVLPTAKKIGDHTITEDYRKQLLALIKILKKTTSMHSKLSNISYKEFYDNIETIAKDF